MNSMPPFSISLRSLHYIPYEELYVPGSHFLTPFHFDSTLIPDNITLPIGNYSQDYQKLKESIKILDNPIPVIDWTSPYHSTWYYLSLLMGIIILCVTVFYLIKHCARMSHGFLALSSLPKAEAADLPGWVEISYDFLLFFVIMAGLIMILIYLRRIMSRLVCHHVQTTTLSSLNRNHVDLIVLGPNINLIIGLREIQSPSYLINGLESPGYATCVKGMLSLNDFPLLTTENGMTIDLNGIYQLEEKISFNRTLSHIRIPSLHSYS